MQIKLIVLNYYINMSSSHFKFKNLNTSCSVKTKKQKESGQDFDLDAINNLNYNKRTLEILDSRNDFLVEEKVLVKGDMIFCKSAYNVPKSFTNFESAAVLNKSKNVEDSETVVSTIFSDTELMLLCDRLEEENKTCAKSPENSIVKQIFIDFCELESDIQQSCTNTMFRKIPYKKKIKKTYSNRKLKFDKTDSCTNFAHNENLSNRNSIEDTSKIDLSLSQPVYQNLLELTSFFFSEKGLNSKNDFHFRKHLKRLEETTIVLDLQEIFDAGNALFYGNLFEYDDIRTPDIEQNAWLHLRKKSPLEDRILRKKNSNRIQPGKFFTTSQSDKKTEKEITKYELIDLWSDEILLQNVTTHANLEEEINANFANGSSQIRKNKYDNNNYGDIKNRKSKSRLCHNALKVSPKDTDIMVTKVLNSENYDQKPFIESSKYCPVFMTASQKKIQISQKAYNRAKLLVLPEDSKID